jgi:hypothetical protein
MGPLCASARVCACAGDFQAGGDPGADIVPSVWRRVKLHADKAWACVNNLAQQPHQAINANRDLHAIPHMKFPLQHAATKRNINDDAVMDARSVRNKARCHKRIANISPPFIRAGLN